MRKTFQEYHSLSEEEIKKLWDECIFVFDANILLNMYKYSPDTVKEYFQVLKALKKQNRLWLPFQVGYEFYENRINVILDSERSYDDIRDIINKADSEISSKYSNHPVLDLTRIHNSFSRISNRLDIAKGKHPNLLENDDILSQINELFEGCTGTNFSPEKLELIKEEGKCRYEKKIPPGFKDDEKPIDKKFGDLIIWNQMIEKAKETKKPIVFISGDVKEDWWLIRKDSKRLLPHPMLRREMLEKANVDFYIYTADRFLELSKDSISITSKTIKEVKEVQEVQEQEHEKDIYMQDRRVRMSPARSRNLETIFLSFEILSDLKKDLDTWEIKPDDQGEILHLLYDLNILRNKLVHGNSSEATMLHIYRYLRKLQFHLERMYSLHMYSTEIRIGMRKHLHNLNFLFERFNMFL